MGTALLQLCLCADYVRTDIFDVFVILWGFPTQPYISAQLVRAELSVTSHCTYRLEVKSAHYSCPST